MELLIFLTTTMIIIGILSMTIYRLYLSPLSQFPGPKLAAVTGFVETYYDCWKRGRYWVYIEEMHKRYGPIIRISPHELHVNDPDWNEPYKISSRVDKYHWYYTFVGSSDAAFGTSDHDLHRVRRKSQQAYFTSNAVAAFEDTLNTLIGKLGDRVEGFKGTGKTVNLSNVFRSLATDVVTEFCFCKSYGLLDSPDFGAPFMKTIREFPEIGLWHRHFGIILHVIDRLPRWLVALVNPAGVGVVDFFDDIVARTNAIVAAHDAKGPLSKETEKPSIIHEMLDSADLPSKEKAAWRLALEARTFVGAGTETTGNTLSVTTFHLLANPEKVQRLRDEVRAAQRQSKAPLRCEELQQLPYLSAVVLEGLRISSSVAGRLPRVNTREAIRYRDYVIPVGTPVSTTQKLTHDNPSLFVCPRSFLPERWLIPSDRKRLEKYVQPFGRGSRSCLGIYLAQAELYLALAQLFGKSDMKLFETVEEDIAQVHDFFSPFPESDRGLRVIIECD